MIPDSSRFLGKYRGTVVNTADPEQVARLQAVVPDVLGTVPTTWAMPSVPFAGPGAGFVVLPPVGAGVWIEFEQGDPDYPIWSGCWWGASGEVPAVARPPAAAGIGQVTIVTPGGNTIVISDLPGRSGGVSLSTPAGARISVAGAEILIDNGHGASIALTGNQVRITGVMV
jgi:uncharacterized protein involved in type VI secretion and phage assembly